MADDQNAQPFRHPPIDDRVGKAPEREHAPLARGRGSEFRPLFEQQGDSFELRERRFGERGSPRSS
jgi:hypothetical protein